MENLKMAKRNEIAKKLVDCENGFVTFKFADGTERLIAIHSFEESIVNQFTLNGISQKLGDSYAKSESVAVAVAKFDATHAHLLDGLWNAGGAVSAELIEALHRATGKPVEDCTLVVRGLTKDQRDSVRDGKEIASHIADIRAEKAREKADAAPETDANLDALFANDDEEEEDDS